MDTIENATRTPETALLPSEFSVYPGASQGMSERANRAYLGDVDLSVGDASRLGGNAPSAVVGRLPEGAPDLRNTLAVLGRASLPSAPRTTPVSAERLRSAFQHVHPRA